MSLLRTILYVLMMLFIALLVIGGVATFILNGGAENLQKVHLFVALQSLWGAV